ncbi:hypothetical protein [Streptomyces sp. MBT53]|uniref:hypothetical protein n=1 Tax=Streptomyces sp. MBT53 TaxID=1488384 RepID=UPI0035AB907C
MAVELALAVADGSAEVVLDAVSEGAGPAPAELVARTEASTSSASMIWVIWSYPEPLPIPVATFNSCRAAAGRVPVRQIEMSRRGPQFKELVARLRS